MEPVVPALQANRIHAGILFFPQSASRISSAKAKEADPKRFFDGSFVREMQKNGFIESLHR